MSKQTINVGNSVNDGTGDTLRNAMIKINANFSEVYSSYTANGTITVGNSTVNSTINSTSLSTNNIFAVSINAASINAVSITGTLVTASQPNITANNTSYVGSVSAANVVSNAQLSANLANYVTSSSLTSNYANNTQLSSNLSNYQTTAGLSANVSTLTANNTSYVGSISAANVVSNAQLSANLANYQTTAGLTANIASYIPTYTGAFNGSSITIGGGSFAANSTATTITSNTNFIGANVILNVTNTYITSNTIIAGTNTLISSNVSFTSNASFLGSLSIANAGNFYVGSANVSSNGFVSLTYGAKMNWGWVSANSSTGNVTFSSAYSINAYCVTATSNTTADTYRAAVISVNNSVAVIRTGNATPTNVFWTAIGL
jgi:hypothetical protein